MSSNLPPGCSVPDGICDPALDSALEALCDSVRDQQEAEALATLAEPLRAIMAAARTEGEQNAKIELEQLSAEREQQEDWRPIDAAPQTGAWVRSRDGARGEGARRAGRSSRRPAGAGSRR